MCDEEKLGRVEEVLPDDICRGPQGGEGIEVGLRHPNTEGCVLLSERLTGGNGRDLVHVFRCRRGVDEYVLIVASFARSRQFISNPVPQTELQQADKEGAG